VRPVPRSLLFAPATSARKIDKAFASEADGVILDLEDAVAVSEKPAAREAVSTLLRTAQAKPVFIRVNALSTPFCFDDLAAVAASNADAIVLPKVERAADLSTADWVLSQFEARADRTRPLEIMPILETADGIGAAAEIAQASRRVRRLAFGAVDLALDMDLNLSDDAGPMAQARFALALASRRAGLEGPFDTAFVDIHALDRLRETALRARGMGFSGKACIHPAQIETVNTVFSPSAAEIETARRIVAAFDEAERNGAAAVSVDGMMIDYPVVEKARRTLLSVRNG